MPRLIRKKKAESLAFFCAHEHLFYRWNVALSTYPASAETIFQSLTGCAGAVPENPASVRSNPGGRIYFGYNFVIVDVEGDTITEKAYAVGRVLN